VTALLNPYRRFGLAGCNHLDWMEKRSGKKFSIKDVAGPCFQLLKEQPVTRKQAQHFIFRTEKSSFQNLPCANMADSAAKKYMNVIICIRMMWDGLITASSEQKNN